MINDTLVRPRRFHQDKEYLLLTISASVRSFHPRSLLSSPSFLSFFCSSLGPLHWNIRSTTLIIGRSSWKVVVPDFVFFYRLLSFHPSQVPLRAPRLSADRFIGKAWGIAQVLPAHLFAFIHFLDNFSSINLPSVFFLLIHFFYLEASSIALTIYSHFIVFFYVFKQYTLSKLSSRHIYLSLPSYLPFSKLRIDVFSPFLCICAILKEGQVKKKGQ